MFPYIYFITDDEKRMVPISDIKDFFPKNVGDYNLSVPVKALWRGVHNEITTGSAERYKALVLKLGGEWLSATLDIFS